MIIHALLALSLSFGIGVKRESPISAYDGIYMIRFSSGPVGFEGGYSYHKAGYRGDLRGYRTDLWGSGGLYLSASYLRFYPHMGFGRYLIEPVESESYEPIGGYLGAVGLSAEWDIPKTNTAVFGGVDITKLFGRPQTFDDLFWSVSGGVMFRAVELP